MRLCALQVGSIGIDRSLADGLHFELRYIALIILLCERRRRFELFELRELRCRVKFNEHLPGFDEGAGFKVNGGHDAADFGRQIGTARGAQIADHFDAGLPGLHLRYCGGYALRWDTLAFNGFLYHRMAE